MTINGLKMNCNEYFCQGKKSLNYGNDAECLGPCPGYGICSLANLSDLAWETANSVGPDQTAPQEQSDLNLQCLLGVAVSTLRVLTVSLTTII